jgi:hypothetical protein
MEMYETRLFFGAFFVDSSLGTAKSKFYPVQINFWSEKKTGYHKVYFNNIFSTNGGEIINCYTALLLVYLNVHSKPFWLLREIYLKIELIIFK